MQPQLPTFPLPVKPKTLHYQPAAAQLRAWTAQMANARQTNFDNLNVATQVLARSKASTFIVSDQPSLHSSPTLPRTAYNEVAKLQNAYIAQQAMIVLDGWIGNDPQHRVAARLIIEQANANIAAMQQQLFFPVSEAELKIFTPKLTVIYTPNLKAPAQYPNERLIAVDLEHYTTRVFNSDYFGESKKGALRMWNKLIYDAGGLAMHAGCKTIPVAGKEKTGLIIGLSGTGKTTTTFTRQNNSSPIQDDFIGLLPSGQVLLTENGCFAKTFGLHPQTEPLIYEAVAHPDAYLENVAQDPAGMVDFFDESYTQNGRATFSFSQIPQLAHLTQRSSLPKVDFILILNRNETIIPAVAKLNKNQAVAFFMLGETKGTAAGGQEEAGKALRIPGTNPFFPLHHSQQGLRFAALLATRDIDVYLLNTGWIGGAKGTAHAKKIEIHHSSALVQAIAEETITWQPDTDFGYQIAAQVPGISAADGGILQPARYYQGIGQAERYQQLVAALKAERSAYLRQYPQLPVEVLKSIGC